MNFENLPAQMLALMLGWSFTVFIQNRSNWRAEALKRKDKIVDKLEELSEWVESEIAKDLFDSTQTETTYSGMIFQIEVRVQQLNQHVGKEIFDGVLLSNLRQIEIFKKADENAVTPYKIREAAADVVEAVESCCNSEYFGRKGIVAALNDYFVHFRGLILLLLCVFIFLAIYQFYSKYMALPLGVCTYGTQCQSAPNVPLPPPQPSILSIFKSGFSDGNVSK